MSHAYQSIPIPRCRIQKPENFAEQVRGLNPLLSPNGWFCQEADCCVTQDPEHPEGVRNKLPFTGYCPVCLKEATLCCSKCRSVFYCSKECQKSSWRAIHKKAYSANPNLYTVNTSLNQFLSLPKRDFEGHEFMIIKPTEKLDSIADICDSVLEGCDDIFDISGFGTDQIDPMWVLTEQLRNPVARRVCQRFGWTSGAYGMEKMEGYRVVEDHTVYCVLFDDSFQNPAKSPGLATSYYGAGCFALPEGKSCRGIVVIFRLTLAKRKWKSAMPAGVSDENNIQFEYELYPLCKAEVAHMLQERTKALEQGAYTRRTWRSHTRLIERNEELSTGMAPFTLGSFS